MRRFVTAGRRDLEGAFCSLLSLHVAQVRLACRFHRKPGGRPVQDLNAFDMIDERDERRGGDDLDAASPGRFGT
jgi:hypothetical protein